MWLLRTPTMGKTPNNLIHSIIHPVDKSQYLPSTTTVVISWVHKWSSQSGENID
jgi:hypothetical protein